MLSWEYAEPAQTKTMATERKVPLHILWQHNTLRGSEGRGLSEAVDEVAVAV